MDATDDNPSIAGDAIGRSPDVAGLGALGHIGFWDGGHVMEVLNEPMVVQRNNLNNFKSRTAYWGKASPNVPTYYVNACFLDSCRGTS